MAAPIYILTNSECTLLHIFTNICYLWSFDDTIYDKGTVTINPVKITLTADSASKTYDGSALKSNGYSITKGSFASGEGLKKGIKYKK